MKAAGTGAYRQRSTRTHYINPSRFPFQASHSKLSKKLLNTKIGFVIGLEGVTEKKLFLEIKSI
ncbi:MAG: hypothetical protein CVV16_11180 [Gammaproteobacteria bacterium HGW-Gammaproteobacteria-6]|nr:MAG: hypothetical protein CVV16_11180 [Gammaproteobacteria bacterium HGW-Gammaproteobacteria-6]